MDAERFMDALPRLFDDFPNSDRPSGRRFDDIITKVPNLSTENNLALLNLAARVLPSDETYVEVGSYAGASLIGAMRGNEDKDFVAIDYFQRVNRQRFELNLKRFGATGATVIAGDGLEVLNSELLDDREIGVLFWDADHSYAGQLCALRTIERRLAQGALVICDNADGSAVKAAIDEWLRGQPSAGLLLELGGRRRGQPWWHDGLRVMRWGT